MRILHTANDLYVKSGGVATCTYNLITGLNALGCQTDIISINNGKQPLVSKNEPWLKFVDGRKTKTPLNYSTEMRDFLYRETEYDLYHTDGIWLYTNHITAKVAKKKNKACIISPQGMLYPQALAISAWKKKIVRPLMFDKDIRTSACLHATCHQEMEFIRRFGYKGPIAVIPNPVSIEATDDSKKWQQTYKIGFLGRLHPRKRVELLIQAFSLLNRKEAQLIIIGSGDDRYTSFLKKEAERLHVNNIVFTGTLTGTEKSSQVSSLSALFTPSDFENFGMVVPEALMMKVPVMANTGTPWEDLNTYHCGWWTDNEIGTLTTIMEKALSLSDEEREIMGNNGRQLVIDTYATDVVAKKMKRLYEWILSGGEKPDFVYVE